MFLSCYLRKGVVYLPTLAKVDAGFYTSIEPVAVVPVSEAADLRRAFDETMARGNPRTPTPSRDDRSPPVILKYAGVKRLSSFERETLVWHIVRHDGVYRITGQRRRAGGGWVPDRDQVIEFPLTATADDVIERMITILQAEAKKSQPRARRVRS